MATGPLVTASKLPSPYGSNMEARFKLDYDQSCPIEKSRIGSACIYGPGPIHRDKATLKLAERLVAENKAHPDAAQWSLPTATAVISQFEPCIICGACWVPKQAPFPSLSPWQHHFVEIHFSMMRGYDAFMLGLVFGFTALIGPAFTSLAFNQLVLSGKLRIGNSGRCRFNLPDFCAAGCFSWLGNATSEYLHLEEATHCNCANRCSEPIGWWMRAIDDEDIALAMGAVLNRLVPHVAKFGVILMIMWITVEVGYQTIWGRPVSKFPCSGRGVWWCGEGVCHSSNCSNLYPPVSVDTRGSSTM